MFRLTQPASFIGWVLVLVSLQVPRLSAQPSQVDGLFLSVANPIDDKAVQLIRRKVEDAILNKKRDVKVVVFDFNPDGLPAATSEWNSPNALAEYILDLRFGRAKFAPLKTVGLVQNEVSRHSVLPVLACQQVFLSDTLDDRRQYKASLGDVSPDGRDAFNNNIRTAYAEVAKYHDSPDLLMRLLDRNLELHQVRYPDGSSHFVSLPALQQLKEKKAEVVDEGVPPGLERGKSRFDPDEARKFGFCQGLVRDRASLQGHLKLSPRSLIEDHLLDQRIKVALFQVRGRIDKGTLNDFKSQVKSALKDGHNFLIFQLESGGGETADVASTAQWLAELKVNDANVPARTVAYIPPKTNIGATTFLALGCQDIVMGPDSSLADFAYLIKEEQQLKDIKEMLLPLVERRGFPRALFEAALTPGMALYHVKDKKDGEDRLVTEAEFLEDKKAAEPRLENHGRIEANPGDLLEIPAKRAREWRIALDSGGSINRVEELYALYGIDPLKVTMSQPGWLYRLAEFFREPLVNFMLIMIGILGLIMELKLPGTTVPGVIAAICFVLFFWSYSFVGEFTMLASLLFVLGLIFIVIEVFLLPGFGFTGITGIFLVIFSMVLATLDNLPYTTQEWVSVGARMTTLGLGVVAAIIAAFVLAYYLPNIPYANRMVLQPPEDEGTNPDGSPSYVSPYAHLLGAIGVAATTLRPAGKAQIGEEFYDVIAEGDYVVPGSRIQVIEVEGNRIVVKEIS